MKKYAVVFLAWGEKYIKEVESCINESQGIQDYDFVLITDMDTQLDNLGCQFNHVVRASFETQGLLRKTELAKFLPEGYDAYLFLDSDTVVVEDISLGFAKAEKFSIAVSPAPHYSLDYFWGFDRIMRLEGMPCKGQLQYNTGVIFFQNSQIVRSVFQHWMDLAFRYQKKCKNDQPFFSLAMEELDFNPYTLSISYNYRGFGDSISGLVRIWHSHGKLPERINEFKVAWPPRRAWPSKVIYLNQTQPIDLISRVRHKIKHLTSLLQRTNSGN